MCVWPRGFKSRALIVVITFERRVDGFVFFSAYSSAHLSRGLIGDNVSFSSSSFSVIPVLQLSLSSFFLLPLGAGTPAGSMDVSL